MTAMCYSTALCLVILSKPDLPQFIITSRRQSFCLALVNMGHYLSAIFTLRKIYHKPFNSGALFLKRGQI